MSRLAVRDERAPEGQERSRCEPPVDVATDDPRDRTVLVLSDDDYDRFVASLDTPQTANERLKALVRRKPLWETP